MEFTCHPSTHCQVLAQNQSLSEGNFYARGHFRERGFSYCAMLMAYDCTSYMYSAVFIEKYKKRAFCSKSCDASKARPEFYSMSARNSSDAPRAEACQTMVQSLFLPFPELEVVKALFWNTSPLLCTHSPLLSDTLGRLSPGSVLPSHT